MELKRISQSRNVLIGVAMIWIAFTHSEIWFRYPIINQIKVWGYGGVDICLFASGIGCWFSLEKDSDYFRFVQRKAKKLYPTYLCFLLIMWLPYNLQRLPMSIKSLTSTLLGMDSFTGGAFFFNWYISFLVVLYLLAPYLKQIAQKTTGMWRHGLVIAMLMIISVAFWSNLQYIIMASRFPIFYIGMIFGKAIQQNQTVSSRQILALVVFMIAGFAALKLASEYFPNYLWSYGFDWYPFILITPGFCLIIAMLSAEVKKLPVLRLGVAALEEVGKHSFEVYLVHDFLYEYIMRQPPFTDDLLQTYWTWIATIPVIFIGCALLNGGAKLLRKVFHM